MARRPIILGIVGDSAAGKSTLTQGVTKLLGPERVTHLCTDDYHKYDRVERARLGITPLHPDCNYLDILELHMERVHYGQAMLKPVYDHSNGTLVRPEYVVPREFVIVEGLLGFHTEVLRQFCDVKVFLDPPEELRRVWKVKRDCTKRGYRPEQVIAELEKRQNDTRNFIRPQREYADLVVRFCPPPEIPPEDAGPNLNVQLVLRPTIPHPDLSYLFNGSQSPDSGVHLELNRDNGRPVDILQIEGQVAAEHISQLEDAIWQHLPDLRPVREDQFGDYLDRDQVRHSGPLALTQLLLTYHLLRKYSDLSDIPFATPVAALSRLQTAPRGKAQKVARERSLSV